MLQHTIYYVKVSDKVAAGAGVRGDRRGFSVRRGTELVRVLMALLAFFPSCRPVSLLLHAGSGCGE